ncbi:hypothetical protein JI743_02905 [Sphingopyxis sp. DHUNG17]|uniref:hypothetical protein n=1 Tax=Sphingopyxis jiangsuensis TaxID=2871171 RepID=UPI00191CC40E|nr:hypothetical protein [Sphingopyxis lutea]MBL0767751.1 hypothetical protein [Sphingopyxis lutea]
MGTIDILFTAVALVVAVLWFWLVAYIKRIERRLDQAHDYFRYIDRGNTWVGPNILTWLLDFLHKYPTLDYADPVLDKLVAQCRIAWTIFACASAVLACFFGMAVWAMSS